MWTIHLKYYVGYTNDHHFPENETERHSRYHCKNRKWKRVKRSYAPGKNCFYHADDIDINWLFHLFWEFTCEITKNLDYSKFIEIVPKRIILETIISDLSSCVDINKFIDIL